MPLQLAWDEPHPRNPGGSEIGRQPFQQITRLMLQEDGSAGLASEREHRALRAFAQPERFGNARDVVADNLPPAQHEGCVREAGALECRRRVVEHVLARRSGASPPGRA